MARSQRRANGPELRLVGSAATIQEPAKTEPADPDVARADAEHADAVLSETMAALLMARQGYRAAVDAADGATVPSLTDFVD